MISGEVHKDHIVDGRNDKDKKTERVWANECTPRTAGKKCINVKKDAGRINSVVNYHSRCTDTCKKQTKRNRGKCKTCRLAVLRRESKTTKISQLLYDPNTNTMTEKEGPIETPPKRNDDWPLEPPDERVLAFDLRRKGVDNQQQIDASPLTTSCLRCNTSMPVFFLIMEVCNFLRKRPKKSTKVRNFRKFSSTKHTFPDFFVIQTEVLRSPS